MQSPVRQDDALFADAAVFRRFNRFYTRFIGTLNEGIYQTAFTLPEGRVLYEIATRSHANKAGPQAKEIAEALNMDAGYLSRILTKFEKTGLIRRVTSKQDSRASNVLLTAKGRASFRVLNTRAETQARAILGNLASASRAQLTAAIQTIQSTVLKEQQPQNAFTLRSHRPGDMGIVVSLEGAGYVEQFGWDSTFEALVAKIVAEFIENFDPAREHCWIAEIDGRHVGHIFLVRHPEQPDTAKLRLLYVDPTARGMGLGQALVRECVEFARQAGYRKVILWTQSMLTSAHRIYQNAGFHLVRQERHHSFGKDLIGQTWELQLD